MKNHISIGKIPNPRGIALGGKGGTKFSSFQHGSTDGKPSKQTNGPMSSCNYKSTAPKK